MEIWITRHGQTNLNKAHLMQGLTDEPLNETGILQAQEARERIGEVRFDAVYASPLQRAVRKYWMLGPAMTLYWAFPEIFPAPAGVETVESLVRRSSDFLKELEKKGCGKVLVACHGGIMRALCGYLADRKNGICWRPKPHNCEIRVFESDSGGHRYLGKK